MQSVMASLGDAPPTLLQQLVFGETPGLLVTVIYSFLLVATVFLGVVSLIAMFSIWWERKVAGHIQSRLGPNRVGPIGILQSLAAGARLILKEDLNPKDADNLLFHLAPYLSFAPRFEAFLPCP